MSTSSVGSSRTGGGGAERDPDRDSLLSNQAQQQQDTADSSGSSNGGRGSGRGSGGDEDAASLGARGEVKTPCSVRSDLEGESARVRVKLTGRGRERAGGRGKERQGDRGRWRDGGREGERETKTEAKTGTETHHSRGYVDSICPKCRGSALRRRGGTSPTTNCAEVVERGQEEQSLARFLYFLLFVALFLSPSRSSCPPPLLLNRAGIDRP